MSTDKPTERSIPRPAASGGGGAGLGPAGAEAGQRSGGSWSDRAALYRDSEAHREGADLDLVVEWSEGAETALDVATGGGHVARRLRETGVNVVTVDSAPGMQPDVVSRSEDIPFADESFDVVVCRVAAHHFDDVPKAVSEMARVSRDRVIVVDNLFLDDDAEEADRVRDPSHVKNWSEGEWRGFFASAGLQVDEARRLEKPIEVEPWLERAGTSGADAKRVRVLLGDRIQDGWITLDRLVIRGRK
jgi:SAM-dependent methyltransferase